MGYGLEVSAEILQMASFVLERVLLMPSPATSVKDIPEEYFKEN